MNHPRFSNPSIARETDLSDAEVRHEYRIRNTAPADRRMGISVWQSDTVVRDESVRCPGDGVLR